MKGEGGSSEPYAARSVRFLGLWKHRGWRMKVYGIAYQGELPSQALRDRATALAARDLPSPADGESRRGVGFIGVHEGRGANLVFVGWWANENELHLLVYTASHERPVALERVSSGGLTGCVWDLAVIAFERRAWIATALLDPTAPDLDGYLATRFEGEV